MRFLLALCLSVLATSPTWAQNPNYTTTSTSAPLPPTVSFRNAPTWVLVPGTKVQMIQQDQRPTYDMFGFNNQYYIYNEGYWYRSDLANGPYASLELNALPPELRSVPRSSWISYPADWTEATTPAGQVIADTWTPTIKLDTVPHWQSVPGSSRVYYVAKSERPAGYDLFRYDSRYYTYQRGNWYSSQSVNGPYVVVPATSVPGSFRTVKKTYWVNYPSGWTYMRPWSSLKFRTSR